ncbi:sulfate/molybdate ABC transporter ATP-binding protein [Nakamurella deserti]|uniref:sulfate/molybdate ABC transporter ATP-binding protein n=1 Tax=Nakamurella deserti TaxID=2164074 RepID=UPI000DBE75CE|nr:ATP-binding cassette domain-containing protein [Nakamurella deserti]
MSAGALSVDVALAARGLELRCEVAAGEVLAVLGPNGAGKSTLLSLVAGLERPDRGRIVLDGAALVDTDAGGWRAPHERRTVLLAQQAMLFPHLTVAANVAFGPRSRGVGRVAAAAAATVWLAAVDTGDLADRRPGELSGGQAQRVAVARALAADPALLLLDEPLAALDVAVAPALRRLLRTVLRTGDRSALLVTHDILDALTLADRVIVLEAGRIVEQGPVREVLSRPRSAFAARIAGVNLVAGTLDGHSLVTPRGERLHGVVDAPAGGAGVALFRPSAVAVHLTPPGGSPRNRLPVTIGEIEPRGELVRVRALDGPDGAAGPVADLTADAAADLDLVPGREVWFVVKATEVTLYPSASPTG